MIEEVKTVIAKSYQQEYDAGNMHIVAASSAGKEETEAWVKEIETAFPGQAILCDELSLVYLSYRTGRTGIGYICKP